MGSTTLITNQSGSLVENTKYDPWGEVKSGGTASKFQYTGQEKDSETGLNYYNARYYDSHIRRFTQPDDIIQNIFDPQTLNRYAYARNNPLRYTDPTGHFIPALIVACAIGCPLIIANINPIITYVTQTYNSVKKDPSMLSIALTTADVASTAVPGGKAVGPLAKTVEKVIPKIPGAEKAVGQATKIANEIFHGNDLRNTEKTIGYTLRDKITGEIKKFGETLERRFDNRYTKKFLDDNDLDMVPEISGSKLDMHYWQHEQILDYKNANGGLRPDFNYSNW